MNHRINIANMGSGLALVVDLEELDSTYQITVSPRPKGAPLVSNAPAPQPKPRHSAPPPAPVGKHSRKRKDAPDLVLPEMEWTDELKRAIHDEYFSAHDRGLRKRDVLESWAQRTKRKEDTIYTRVVEARDAIAEHGPDWGLPDQAR